MRTGIIVLISTVALAACGTSPETSNMAANDSAAAPASTVEAGDAPVAGTYTLDTNHAALLTSIAHNKGVSNYVIRFDRMEGELALNPDNIAASTITLSVDPTSLSTAYSGDFKATHPKSEYASWTDELINGDRYMNAKAFPTIGFKSTAVEQTGPRTAKVTGDLSFLGVTKPITLEATLNGALAKHPFTGTPVIGFSAEGTFKRSDFGMASGPVGDVVTVRFDGEFNQKPAE